LLGQKPTPPGKLLKRAVLKKRRSETSGFTHVFPPRKWLFRLHVSRVWFGFAQSRRAGHRLVQ
jgi:hypothetical protein